MSERISDERLKQLVESRQGGLLPHHEQTAMAAEFLALRATERTIMNETKTAQITEYRVEPEGKGCPHCGMGEVWSVVNSMNIAMPTSYGDKESAQEMAEDLNAAFSRGWNAASEEHAFEVEHWKSQCEAFRQTAVSLQHRLSAQSTSQPDRRE